MVGFAAVGPARDADVDSATTGELRVVVVEARARGLGIGSALIGAAERALRDSRFSAATLWVLRDDAPAVRCYERCRWRAGGKRITDFGGREIRSVRYERRLTA